MATVLATLNDGTLLQRVLGEGEANIHLINIMTHGLSLEISLKMIEKKSVHQKRENYIKIFKYFRTPKRADPLGKSQGRGSRIMTTGSGRVSGAGRDFMVLIVTGFTLREKANNVQYRGPKSSVLGEWYITCFTNSENM